MTAFNRTPITSAVKTQFGLDFAGEIRVDLFAGGGGATMGQEMSTGMSVDIAINHNPDAISMHKRNHPSAEHYITDVYDVCPRVATSGRKFSNKTQVLMVGNSVSPQPMAALIRANMSGRTVEELEAA